MLSSTANNQQVLTPADKGHLASLRELEGLLAQYNEYLLERLTTASPEMHVKQDFNLVGLAAKIKQKINHLNQLANNLSANVHPLIIKEAKVYSSHLRQACQDFQRYADQHAKYSSKHKTKKKSKKFKEEQALKEELKNKAAIQKIELSLTQNFETVVKIINERFGTANNTNTFGPQLQHLLTNVSDKYQDDSWGKMNGILTGDFIAAYYPHTQAEGNRDQLVIDAVNEFTKSELNASSHSALYHCCDIISGINDIRLAIARIKQTINNVNFAEEEKEAMVTAQIERLKSLSESLPEKIALLDDPALNPIALTIKDSFHQIVSSLPPTYLLPEPPKPTRKKTAPLPLFELRQPPAAFKIETPSTEPLLVVKPKVAAAKTLKDAKLEPLVTINNTLSTHAIQPNSAARNSAPREVENAINSSLKDVTTPAPINPIAQAQPIDLAKLFKEKLKTVFVPTQWQHTEQADKTTLINKAEKGRQFNFIVEQESFQFTSSELGRKDMIKAVGALQEVCSENTIELDFALEAADEQQAVTFLKELKSQGFDINGISLIECKTPLPAGVTAEEFTQAIITKAHSNPPAP